MVGILSGVGEGARLRNLSKAEVTRFKKNLLYLLPIFETWEIALKKIPSFLGGCGACLYFQFAVIHSLPDLDPLS